MGSLYYVDAAQWLRGVGLTVDETDGWQHRARSSGGFAAVPLGCVWHHTASKASPESDLNWMINGSDDAPIGNALIDRAGVVHLIAGGASNTAGKGGPITFSRGTVGKDSGNTTTWNWEVANAGTGEAWPRVQIDAYFTASNEMNHRLGNQPTDLVTHNGYCAPSCPGRKIDPATAAAVQGPWQPRSCSSAGTWNQDDIRAEAKQRAAGPAPEPEPEPPPEEDDEMMYLARLSDGAYVVAGSAVRPVSVDELHGPFAQLATFTPNPSSTWHAWLKAGADEYGRRVGMT